MKLDEAFKRNVSVLSEIHTDLESLKVKFGENSKLYESKKAQLDWLLKFHNMIIEYIDTCHQAIDSGYMLNSLSTAILHSKDSDLSLDETLEAMGLPSSKDILSHPVTIPREVTHKYLDSKK